MDDIKINPVEPERSQVELHLPKNQQLSTNLHESIQSEQKVMGHTTLSKISNNTLSHLDRPEIKKLKLSELKNENKHLKDTIRHYRMMMNSTLQKNAPEKAIDMVS